MATLGVTIKSDFDQASKDLKDFEAQSESTKKSIERFQKSFKTEQIDKFIDKQKLNRNAIKATRGELDANVVEYKNLQREIERLIRRGLDPLDEDLKKLTSRYDKLGKEIDQAQKEQKKLQEGTKKSASVFSDLGTVLAGLGIVEILKRAGEAIIGFVKKAGEFEQVNVAFRTFLGNAEDASKIIKELQEFSAITPFTQEQVLQAGKGLLAFGIEADNVRDKLKQIGDLSAGTGKDFNELSTIFGKARVAGVLFAEDINQLTEAGIPVIDEFAKQLGVSTSEVKKLASQGKIGFDELETAFNNLTGPSGKFFNLTEEQSKTFLGQISTLQSNLSQLAIKIGDELVPAIEPLVKELIKISTSEEAISVVVGAFKILLTAIELVKLNFKGFINFFRLAIDPIVEGVKGLVDIFILLKEKGISGASDAFKIVKKTGIDSFGALIDAGKRFSDDGVQAAKNVAAIWTDANKKIEEDGKGFIKSQEDIQKNLVANNILAINSIKANEKLTFGERIDALKAFNERVLENEKILQEGKKEIIARGEEAIFSIKNDLSNKLFEEEKKRLELIKQNEDITLNERIVMLQDFIKSSENLYKLTASNQIKLQKMVNREIKKYQDDLNNKVLSSFKTIASGMSSFADNIATILKNLGKDAREWAVAQKIISIATAVINTSVAITKALSSVPFPLNIAAAATTGAAGAAEVAAIATTPIPSAQTGTSPDGLTVNTGRGRSGQDNVGIKVADGETVSVTPRGEEQNKKMTINLMLDNEILASATQDLIDSGDINITANNVQGLVLA